MHLTARDEWKKALSQVAEKSWGRIEARVF